MSARLAAGTAATLDAVIVASAAFIAGWSFGQSPQVVLRLEPGLVYGFVAPFCALVWWRGFVHTRRIQAGELGWRQPIREGFIAGFAPFPISQALFIVSDSLAAGPAHPSLGSSSILEWGNYCGLILGASIVLGVIGAAGAAGLSWLNRALVPRLSS